MSAGEGRPQQRDVVQRQARALGDPTRYEMFRYVAAASAPVRVSTLTEHFGFNHNVIRQHLAKLTEAGLLVEALARSTTAGGRPPLEYRVALSAMGSWGAPGPYELLAVLLLDVARGTHSPVEAGAEAGRRLAPDYLPDADPLDVLQAEMARRGFEPRREAHGALIELVLERCPFQAAATADPEIVCAVHRGLAEGILEGMNAESGVRDLVAFDPAGAGCRLQVEPRPAPPPG